MRPWAKCSNSKLTKMMEEFMDENYELIPPKLWTLLEELYDKLDDEAFEMEEKIGELEAKVEELERSDE